jgi:lipopolysaccharide transport system ATP-binding protein
LLKILSRITPPTEGEARLRGRVGALLEVGTGFHPELTGRENIFLNGAILDMRRQEIQSRFDEIVEFADVGPFIDTPVKRYSSGMQMRLAFSVAAHLEPEILLIDEVLAVGDAEFQKRCLGRMEEFGSTGRTVLFVSHNMQAIAQLCERAIWIDAGEIAADGPSGRVVSEYLQAGHGSSSSREWPDLATAPGNHLVKLRKARVVQDGVEASAVDVRRQVGIEIGFVVLDGNGPPLFPKIKLVDQRGDVIFNALDTDPRWHGPAAPGEYVSTAWIPGNFLNEGFTTVHVTIVSLGAPKLVPLAGTYDTLSFHVQDSGAGDSARGRFTGQFQGVTRPLLEWTTEEP